MWAAAAEHISATKRFRREPTTVSPVRVEMVGDKFGVILETEEGANEDERQCGDELRRAEGGM